MSIYCQKCGTQNNDDSKFCCSCATPLAVGVVAENNKKEAKTKLYSAFILNLISAVVLILSVALIAYGVSTSTGSIDHTDSINGFVTDSSHTDVYFDTSGAGLAYFACVADAFVAAIGFAIYYNKDDIKKKRLTTIYMIGACVVTCILFFGGVRTISFTCGLGFVMTVAGILQIVAGTKFLAATKNVE